MAVRLPPLPLPLLLLLVSLAALAPAFLLPPSPSSASTHTRCHASQQPQAQQAQSESRRGFLLERAGGLAAASSLLLLRPQGARAEANPREALKRVIIVRDSTAQLEDELTNGTGTGSEPDVKALVTSLLKNYQLRQSLADALALSKNKADAEAHAKLAVEDLYTVLEFFPEEVDGPIKGKIRLVPQVLSFTLRALMAARGELNAYLATFPADFVQTLAEEVKAY